ncbi:hypothetical protein N9795_01170 [Candidatus Pelagibacter sp.]|nr:hypothetical protein [Candidatus Pelagibacter sp.]
MNLDAFRKVIREEVKKAIQEEMREVLLEAVKSASTPKSFGDASPTLVKPYVETKSEYKPKFSEIIAEQRKLIPSTGNPMLDILNETAQAGEWRSLNGGDNYNAANAVGWAGGAPGMMGGGSNTPVVATVDEMIKSQGPVRDINDVRIDVVPDFSKLMGALKEKGSI